MVQLYLYRKQNCRHVKGEIELEVFIDHEIVEKANSFNYLGNLIYCEKEAYIDNKLVNYLKITGICNNMFRPQKTLKKVRIKLYRTLALPVLLYGSENWTIKARNARRITAAEMKYVRKTAEYAWADYKTNTEIAKEPNIIPLFDKIQGYRRNWLQHINRMPL